MLPRTKLIQCFSCKNNLACWGLLEDIPLGKDENVYSIPTQALTFMIAQNMDGLSIKEQFGMFCAAFLQTLRYDQKSDLREICELVNVLCALSNTISDAWLCPGEVTENDFMYEPRATVQAAEVV